MGDRPEGRRSGTLGGLSPEVALARLPAGRHGLPRSFVAHNQRLRIIAAMLRVLPERGYRETTIAHLTREAGVSRAAFYQQFTGKEDCFLVANDLAGEWFSGRVEEGAAGQVGSGRVRRGIEAGLSFLAGNFQVAHLLAIEAPQAGRGAAGERHQVMLERCGAALWSGCPEPGAAPDELAALLLGGAFALIARYVEGGRTERLPEAAPLLAEYLATPWRADPG